jgi:hypothetical protein
MNLPSSFNGLIDQRATRGIQEASSGEGSGEGANNNPLDDDLEESGSDVGISSTVVEDEDVRLDLLPTLHEDDIGSQAVDLPGQLRGEDGLIRTFQDVHGVL